MRHQADPFPAGAVRHIDDLGDRLVIRIAIAAHEDVIG
jgi:hypothetical protein